MAGTYKNNCKEGGKIVLPKFYHRRKEIGRVKGRREEEEREKEKEEGKASWRHQSNRNSSNQLTNKIREYCLKGQTARAFLAESVNQHSLPRTRRCLLSVRQTERHPSTLLSPQWLSIFHRPDRRRRCRRWWSAASASAAA